MKTNINITEVLKLLNTYKTLIKDIIIILMFGYIFYQMNEISDLTIKYNEILNDNIKNQDYINELLNNQKNEELTIPKKSGGKNDISNTELVGISFGYLILLILYGVYIDPDFFSQFIEIFKDSTDGNSFSDDSESDY